jgi:hypothetical protein
VLLIAIPDTGLCRSGFIGTTVSSNDVTHDCNNPYINASHLLIPCCIHVL